MALPTSDRGILAFLKQSNSSGVPQNASGARTGGGNISPFDPSEFPSLGRSTSTGGHASTLPAPVGVGGNGSEPSRSNETGLYSENFPALPQSRTLGGNNLGGGTSFGQQQVHMPTNATSRNHNTPLTGSYGLLGLMGLIRMEDPDRGSLALGSDLTSLGLNLNSAESLYTIFSGPWDDSSHETLFSLPASYPKHSTVRPEILERLNLESLFVCFYSMPRDMLQILAAQELVNRGWRFHEELRLWFSQAKSGSVAFFDVHVWERRIFSGRLPDGFESGFLAPEKIIESSKQALNQLERAKEQQRGDVSTSD